VPDKDRTEHGMAIDVRVPRYHRRALPRWVTFSNRWWRPGASTASHGRAASRVRCRAGASLPGGSALSGLGGAKEAFDAAEAEIVSDYEVAGGGSGVVGACHGSDHVVG
jgi:hypothetical protein